MGVTTVDNLLPADGEVYYQGVIYTSDESQYLFDQLCTTIEWRHDVLMMFGREIVTKREVAWYGDDGLSYRYSGRTKHPLRWTEGLLRIKKDVEHLSGTTFNSCLLNLYHNGEEGMSWHSDDEPELLTDGAIASVSFGPDRRFLFRHKESKEIVEVVLENGSLLLMQGACQRYWQHRLPPMRRVKTPRINLTFRTVVQKQK